MKFTRVDSVDPNLPSVAREAVLVNKAPAA
jgi:hypothetical protein